MVMVEVEMPSGYEVDQDSIECNKKEVLKKVEYENMATKVLIYLEKVCDYFINSCL